MRKKKPNICQKCHKEFPQSVIIDGMFRSLHRRAFCLECVPYTVMKATNDASPKACNQCKEILPVTEFYTKNGWLTANCKSCIKNKHRQTRIELKSKCVQYKGGFCQRCGYDKNYAALDFHHRDPSQKEFQIRANRLFNETMKKELDKCDLLCSNCHREIHNPEQQKGTILYKTNGVCSRGTPSKKLKLP